MAEHPQPLSTHSESSSGQLRSSVSLGSVTLWIRDTSAGVCGTDSASFTSAMSYFHAFSETTLTLRQTTCTSRIVDFQTWATCYACGPPVQLLTQQ